MSANSEWAPLSTNELQQYYYNWFPQRKSKLPEWITPAGPKQYALALSHQYDTREESNAPAKEFIRRDTRNSDDPSQKFMRDWETIEQLIQRPAKHDPLYEGTRSRGLAPPDQTDGPEPVASAVYYALDNWEHDWILAFDIDAKDIVKTEIAGETGHYEDVSKSNLEQQDLINAPPAPATHPDTGEKVTYPYTFEHLNTTIDRAFELQEWLESTVGFEETRVFYSGQGAHVYALDGRGYYSMTYQSRQFIADYVAERLEIPIDRQVTWDESRVIRLPQSAHADVGRVVEEITTPDFDPQTDSTAIADLLE